MLETTTVQCPYCWEEIEIAVDPSVATQSYVEDCFVCCRPIVLDIAIDDGHRVVATATREND